MLSGSRFLAPKAEGVIDAIASTLNHKSVASGTRGIACSESLQLRNFNID